MRAAAGLMLSSLVALLAGCTASPPTPPALVRPNLLLVTVDTLRADRLGTAVTPVIDAVASRGLRFTNARTVAPLTLPAHTSILTGLLPQTHGVHVNGVSASVGTRALAHRLRAAGYRTGAVVGAFVLDRRFGLAEGFDAYDDDIDRHPAALDRLEAERPANVVVDRAIGWLGSLAAARPWFLWVHLYDPHAPYAAPGAKERGSPYDAEASFADAEIGRLLDAVTTKVGADQTAVVIASDHGEGLGEHGESTHGMLLFDSTLRVVLIVTASGVQPAVRAETVSVIDVVPTLMAMAGLAADASLPGRNLLAPPEPAREIYAETDYPAVAGWQRSRALIQERYKVIASGATRLFDVAADPSEHRDLASSDAHRTSSMAARLAAIASAAVTAPSTSRAPDNETAARLRALGYVAGGTARSTPQNGGALADAADHTEAWAAFERALSERARGRTREAAPHLADLSRRFPDAAIFQSTYAQLLADSGRSEEALRALRAMVRRWPTDASLQHELATVARGAGRREEALAAERLALALDPSLAMAHNGLGLLLAEAGKHQEAAAAFEQAVRRDPTSGPYLANLGNARRALGDLERARQSYQLALDRDATLADAANGIGVVLVQQRRAAEAVPWFERAVSSDAGFVEAHLNLGIALQESGQHEQAVRQYREVERLARAGTREREAARTLRAQLERP